MAAKNFAPVSLSPPEFSTSTAINHRKPATFPRKKRPLFISFATSSQESSTAAPEKPEIELEFIGGKLMNCGGGGSCGTSVVEIIDGKDLLKERTNTELRYLKKKPDSWRLACQTIVGNKENSGKVGVIVESI